MKIVHVITGLNVGGAEMMLFRLVSEQMKQGLKIEVVSLGKNGAMKNRIEQLGVSVVELGISPRFPSPWKYLCLIRLIRQFKPDVLHTWMYHANLLGGIAAKVAGKIPVVWGIHHTTLDKTQEKRLTILIAHASGFLSRMFVDKIAYCSNESRRIHEALGYERSKGCVIPNGFDLKEFKPDAAAREKIRSELRVGEGVLLVGLIGRFHPQKDHGNFIQAAKLLHEQVPKAKFVLCGSDVTKDNRALTDLIDDVQLRDSFFLLGQRHDIPDIMNALDICSTSSAYGEAFPLVIGEAMACEVPCVVTNVGDSAEIVADTGRTVIARDPKALAAAWRELLQMNAADRAALGRQARRRIEENFTIASAAAGYQKAYDEVAGKAPTLALFFTRGFSLRIWDEVGNLPREIRPYNELAKSFAKIWFFTYGDERDFVYKDRLADNIIIVPKRWHVPNFAYEILLSIALRREIRQADILKTNQMKGGLAAYLSKKLHRKPLVVRCGYEWLAFSEKMHVSRARLWLIRNIERIVYRNADQIILSAGNLKEFVINRFHIPETKITIIPNYIFTDVFQPIDIEKNKMTVCFVGRLMEQKNLFNLITAVSGLGIKLVLFGSGELEEDLKAHAKEQGADVDFRGNIANEDLPRELNKAGIFILPSLYEGNPKVLLEAMACGLPVIATDVIGNRELIKHRENGYLCGTDATSIREAITTVMNDRALQEAMGKNARETIVKDFALPVVLEKERNVYANL